MNRLEARKIAKIAYKQISEVVEQWEKNQTDLPISIHWDGCITVGNEFFTEMQLIECVEDEC